MRRRSRLSDGCRATVCTPRPTPVSPRKLLRSEQRAGSRRSQSSSTAQYTPDGRGARGRSATGDGQRARRARARSAGAGKDRRILDGIRVVDCSEGIAGPVAAHDAGRGRRRRDQGGATRRGPVETSEGFLTWNRSKRSVVLDLATGEGRADSIVCWTGPTSSSTASGRPRPSELGLTDDGAAAAPSPADPCAVLGWPAGHPSADGAIDDLLVSARLGLCDEQQGHRDGPVFLRFPFGSWCAAYLATIGVMARLIQRQRGGAGGGPAHTSMAQGALVPTMMHWARAETPGPMFAFGLPKDLEPSLFECADGVWVHLMRCADTDSPLMVQAWPTSARTGWPRPTPPTGLIMPGLPELRRQPELPFAPFPASSGWTTSGPTTSRPRALRPTAPSWPTNRPGGTGTSPRWSTRSGAPSPRRARPFRPSHHPG